MIKRKKIVIEGEYLVLAYMVMNLNILSNVFSRYTSKEIKASHFTREFRPIFRWVINYYKNHKKAPKKTINDIFLKNSKNLNKDTRAIIKEYLHKISEEYFSSEDNYDEDYIREEILPDFIRERELQERILKTQDQLDRGEFKQAEKTFSEYSIISNEPEEDNLGAIIPMTKEDLVIGMSKEELSTSQFNFEGDLNNLIGPLCKGWLVAITGTEKSGKSYLMQEIGYQAATKKKRVLCINLELSKELVRNRLWRRVSCTANEDNFGKMFQSILDCENNQYGTCKALKKLKNTHNLHKTPNEVVSFIQNKKWIVCNECRYDHTRKNAPKNKMFIPTPWFEETFIKKMTESRIRKSLKKNKFSHLSNFRVKCFPRFSINFDESREFILRYIDKYDWVPHIIIYDYLDILANEKGLEGRFDIDMKWKKAAKLAGEIGCLVLNADQATKASRTQYALDQMSTSESKTKDGHLDVRIALNQTDDEKDLDIARINVLFHRHKKFNPRNEVLVTQRLITAQPLHDNAFLFKKGTKYNVIPKNI